MTNPRIQPLDPSEILAQPLVKPIHRPDQSAVAPGGNTVDPKRINRTHGVSGDPTRAFPLGQPQDAR